MGKMFGIEFAPLNVPFERRLQTMAAMHHVALFIFVPWFCTALFFYILFFTHIYWISLLYFCWMLWDFRTSALGGRIIPSVQKAFIFNHLRDFFPIRLVKTVDLDPSRNYIIGYHPHGISSVGCFINFSIQNTGFKELFPGIKARVCTLVQNFQFPFFRELVFGYGFIAVSKESIGHMLTKSGDGNAVVIVIGGAQEALDARPGCYDLTIESRHGFVKMALKFGADLVPTFSFGENDVFVQSENPKGSFLRYFQETVKGITGVSPAVFHGRGVFNYTFGMLPFRRPIVTVVGSPIPVTQTDRPTDLQVEELHTMYKKALADLFDAHKATANPRMLHLDNPQNVHSRF